MTKDNTWFIIRCKGCNHRQNIHSTNRYVDLLSEKSKIGAEVLSCKSRSSYIGQRDMYIRFATWYIQFDRCCNLVFFFIIVIKPNIFFQFQGLQFIFLSLAVCCIDNLWMCVITSYNLHTRWRLKKLKHFDWDATS